MLSTTKVSVERQEGMRLAAHAGDYTMIMDQPVKAGGSGQGPVPSEILLSALGGCITMVALGRAQMQHFQLDDFAVEVEGDRDTRGSKGSDQVRPGFLEIRIKVRMKSPEPQDRCDEFVRYVESLCPMADTIGHGTAVKLVGVEKM